MSHSLLLVLDIETVPERELLPPDHPPSRLAKAIHRRVVAIARPA